MSIITRMAAFLAADPRQQRAMLHERYQAAAQTLPEYRVGRPTWPDRDPDVYDRDGYRQIALIYRCVNLISHAAGTAPVRVYNESAKSESLPDHRLRRLMRQPNPQMGEAIFWAHVTLRTAIAGFCVVEKERNGYDEVIGLHPLRPAWLRAVPQTNGPPDWEYRIPGLRNPYRFAARDVVVFRWADTIDGSPYGLGPIAACLRDTALLTKMIDFLGVLFERGGVPLWGVVPDLQPGQRLKQPDVDAMTELFLQRHGGIAKAAIPIILGGIKDIKRLGFDLNELAYTGLRDVSELTIVQAFGVPPTKAMIRVGLEHSDSRANAEVDDATFYRDTMVPLWTRFDDALTTSLLPDFEPLGSPVSLEFDTSDVAALQPNRDERAKWIIAGFQAGGFSHHTLHRELGLPDPATPDFYLRGFAVQAIPVTNPIGGGEGGALAAQWREAPARALAEPPRQALGTGTGPSERLAAIGAANKRLIGIIAEARAPSIAQFFRGQGERVIAALKAPVGIAALAGASDHAPETYAITDLPWDDEDRLLAEVLRQLHGLAGETAFAAASDQIGVEIAWNLANPNIGAILDRLAGSVVGIKEETRADIGRVVGDGLTAGKPLDEIAADLHDLFTETYPNRAMTIARTESMVAFGEASVLGYERSGVVDEAKIFDNPNHTDSYRGAADGLTCAERNGIVVPLDRVMHHIRSDHPNGSACAAPVLRTPLGEVE